MTSFLLALALLAPPVVGDKAPAFDVLDLQKKPVRLAPLLRKGPVVLVVLRGYPGYQCPFCTRQFGELISKAPEFEAAHASLVAIYPGPAQGLDGYAKEFVAGRDIPKDFHLATDPDYGFTKRYDLRWDAPHETAYPSTFVIAQDGRVVYAKISHSHGDRAPVADLLKALATLGPKG